MKLYPDANMCHDTDRLLLKSSFVIATICRDGIILASETRANIFDKTDPDQNPIAYYDGIEKIFSIGSMAMAETGQGLILNTFFSAIVNRFTQAMKGRVRVDQLLPEFVTYCEQQFPSAFVNEIKRQKLFSAGYIHYHPTICYFNEEQPGGPFGCIQDSGLIQSDETLLTSQAEKLRSLSAEKAANLSKDAIESCVIEGDRWKTMGGPVDVLLVSKTGCRWLEKESQARNWRYVQDLIAEYRNGKLELNPIPPATRDQLENLLATVPKNQ